MAKTLPYENLDVGASEKTIQSILEFSKVTANLPLPSSPQDLEFYFKNWKSPHPRAFFLIRYIWEEFQPEQLQFLLVVIVPKFFQEFIHRAMFGLFR